MSWFPPARPDIFVNVFIENLNGIALEWAIAVKEGLTSMFDYTANGPKVRVHSVNEPDNVQWWLQVWGTPGYPGVPEWNPLTCWALLGKLIDKYELTFTVTHRDHPEHRFMSFCPGDTLDVAGRGYASNRKTAMLRAILLQNNPGGLVQVPLDLANFAGCEIHPEHLATCESCTGDEIDMTLPESERHEVYIDNDF